MEINLGEGTIVSSSLSSVQFSRSVVSDSLQPHELQHARPPCLSRTPGVQSFPDTSDSLPFILLLLQPIYWTHIWGVPTVCQTQGHKGSSLKEFVIFWERCTLNKSIVTEREKWCFISKWLERASWRKWNLQLSQVLCSSTLEVHMPDEGMWEERRKMDLIRQAALSLWIIQN